MRFDFGGSIFAAPNQGEKKTIVWVGEGRPFILKSSLTDGKRKVLNRSQRLDKLEFKSEKIARTSQERMPFFGTAKDYTMESLILAQDER